MQKIPLVRRSRLTITMTAERSSNPMRSLLLDLTMILFLSQTQEKTRR